MTSEEQFRDAIHERLRALVGDHEAAYLMDGSRHVRGTSWQPGKSSASCSGTSTG